MKILKALSSLNQMNTKSPNLVATSFIVSDAKVMSEM